MSHFTVLVIGDNVDEQLAPYHEFECTGDDNYIQDIDVTEEARKRYIKATDRRYQSPNGKIHSGFTKKGEWKKQFLREPTPEELAAHNNDFIGSGMSGNLQWTSHDWGDGKGYRAKIVQIPVGWKEVEVLTRDYETFAEWIEGYYGHKVVPFGEEPDLRETHKYGYTIVDENGEVVKTVDRTNPNKKWDWYQVGGRWNGFFKLKPAAVAVGAGMLGIAGLNRLDPGYEPPAIDRADSCLKGEIDVEGMRQEAEAEAAERYDKVHDLVGDLSWEPWTVFLERFGINEGSTAVIPGGIDAARDAYHAQPAILALRSSADYIWEPDDFLVSREAYLQAARDGAILTFALVKDGEWHERGSMGWFGCVSDAKDRDIWVKQCSDLIDSLPDDTLLTVCDCHI